MKKTKFIFLFTTFLLFSTCLSASAEIPSLSVIIGDKGYSLSYANNPANFDEIKEAILKCDNVMYIKSFNGKWIDNITGKSVDKNIIPAVLYKNNDGNIVRYSKGDSNIIKLPFTSKIEKADFGSRVTIELNKLGKGKYKNASSYQIVDNNNSQEIISCKTKLGNSTIIVPVLSTKDKICVKLLDKNDKTIEEFEEVSFNSNNSTSTSNKNNDDEENNADESNDDNETDTDKSITTRIPKVSGKIEDDTILLNWTEVNPKDFKYYKVVISMFNATPKYPENGYLYWFSDDDETTALIDETTPYYHGDFGKYLTPGKKYYFSVTAVYKNQKYCSNSIALTYPKKENSEETKSKP